MPDRLLPRSAPWEESTSLEPEAEEASPMIPEPRPGTLTPLLPSPSTSRMEEKRTSDRQIDMSALEPPDSSSWKKRK